MISRLSNHPDFVGILPILLENPESRLIQDRDGKNPDFDICSEISKLILIYDTHTSTPNGVYLTKVDVKNRTMKYKLKSSTCTRRHANKNKQKKWQSICAIQRTFKTKFSTQNPGNGFQSIKISKFSKGKNPQTPSGSPNRHQRDSSV